MQSHFGVEDNKAEEVKMLVRSYPSMRFESNPWSIGGRTYFNISGDVHEFNDFNMKLYEKERAFQQSVQRTGLRRVAHEAFANYQKFVAAFRGKFARR